ncbi:MULTISPECIES: roadblock/LC7 domain-containing protein [Streptomyces]|uniref:Dynein regulation protein LC7 n=1 Tax=Streptomyces canarius TaxID=285453 RepID=A0ABQ3DBN1_9ACTN|nr:roadblock/LC7 domain-containing protein [Streptomyces canarius]GHA68422.1 dynein regulation protein LC7 [Streptomyces canarius]
MSSVPDPARPADLNRLLNDMVRCGPWAGHEIVVSVDGLLLASSEGPGRDHARQLSAVAAGFHGLAEDTGRHFGGDMVVRTVVEMEHGRLFVCAVGENACMAVLAPEGADVEVVASGMTRLAGRVGRHLGAGSLPPVVSATG